MNREEIDKILLETITPIIAVDGGEIELVGIDDDAKRVEVRFGGSYLGSPCRGVVLKYIVEPVLQTHLDAQFEVEMVD